MTKRVHVTEVDNVGNVLREISPVKWENGMSKCLRGAMRIGVFKS